MFLGIINNVTSVANTNIPITTDINTNKKITNNSNTNVLNINKTGIYKLEGYIQASGVIGDATFYILEDGLQKREVTVTLPTATAIEVVPIMDVFRSVCAQYPIIGNVSIQTNVAGLELNGLVSVEYVQ